MKKKAAFVDHSYHKQTLSSKFIKELLSDTFELKEYYDESWNNKNKIDIHLLKNYEYIFYFQYISEVKELKKLKIEKINIVWFPMWDDVVNMKKSEWIRYQTIPIKVVCFSKKLYNKLNKYGFDCEYFQYYLDPLSVKPVTDYDSKRVYFWNRVEEINWSIVRKILGNKHIDSLVFMAVPDPNQNPEIPPEKDVKNYNIQFYNKFLDYQKYNNVISSSNIYIAPRKFEGIGMSFLEALCRGQCVIAPNFPTMNEYIVHGVNGYLYDLDKLQEINIENFKLVGENARARSFDGFKKWQHQKIKLVEYVSNSYKTTKKKNSWIYIKIYFFKMQEVSFLMFNKVIKIIKLILSKTFNGHNH